MKKIKIILCMLALLFFTTACSFSKNNYENATVYTTVYPVKYLMNYLYSDYGEIASIYPTDCDYENYKLTDKQIKKYSKADFFLYNGLSKEKEIAKSLINKNKNLKIIDVSYGLSLNNDMTELWINPNNYLMLAKNIKSNLNEYINNKTVVESINKQYDMFEEKISIMDASLHNIGKIAQSANKNTIVVSNNSLKFLNNYGFKVISLQDEANLKESKLNAIKNNFNSKKYKYILTADTDFDNDLINEFKTSYEVNLINVDTMTVSMNDDYFNIITTFIENLKTITS